MLLSICVRCHVRCTAIGDYALTYDGSGGPAPCKALLFASSRRQELGLQQSTSENWCLMCIMQCNAAAIRRWSPRSADIELVKVPLTLHTYQGRNECKMIIHLRPSHRLTTNPLAVNYE